MAENNWRQGLSERDRKEVELAALYSEQFAHGTDGHGRLLLIAKMAEILDGAQIDQGFPYSATLDGSAFVQWLHEVDEAPPIMIPIGVIVLARAPAKRGEKRVIVAPATGGDTLLQIPVPLRFLTIIRSDPPMSSGGGR